jgi:hypothetical protein
MGSRIDAPSTGRSLTTRPSASAPGRHPNARPTDGSAAAGGRSASPPARRRGPRGPPGRTASTWANSGRVTGGRLRPPDRAKSARKVPGQARRVMDWKAETAGQAGRSWTVKCGQRLAYRSSQISIGQGRRRGGGAEEVGARPELGPDLSGDRPQPAPNPVAHDCATGPTADGVGDPWRFGGITRQPGYRDRPPSHAPPAGAQGLERGPVTDGPDQAVTLWRPLRRRADRMARPALVDMR